MTQQIPAAAVGAEVRGLLAKHRISHRIAMDRLGISQSAWSRRLSGEIPFDVNELATLSSLLDVPVTVLLGDAA